MYYLKDLREASLEVYNLQERIQIFSGSGLYDFSIQGGAQGNIALSILPENTYIVRAWYEVISAFTSSGAATVAFGISVDDAVGLKTAVVYNHADYLAGVHDFIPDGSAANFTNITTASRNVIMTIATADLTGGKIKVWYQGITSEAR